MLKQLVMLVLSPFLLLKAITSSIPHYYYTSQHSSSIPTIPLQILPEKLGTFHNCIHIYMYFWNSFHPSHFLHNHRIKITKSPYNKKTKTSSFHHHHLFILLYFILNVSITTVIYNNRLPIASLSTIPTLLGTTFLYHHINFQISLFSYHVRYFNDSHRVLS
jgi:hypothetical protein